MINIAKYEKELMKIIKESNELPAIIDGIPNDCEFEGECQECLFSDDGEGCHAERFISWCLSDDEPSEDCCDCIHNATVTCVDCSHSHKSMFERKPPENTRQAKFLKQHPEAATYGGVVKIFPCYLEPEIYNCTHEPSINGDSCRICRSNYWMQEVE